MSQIYTNRLSLAAALSLAVAFVVTASAMNAPSALQEQGGAVPAGGGVSASFLPNSDPDYGTAAGGDKVKDAKRQAMDYIAQRGWKLGLNGKSFDTGFQVYIGEAAIPIGDQASLSVRRTTAATQALLDVKKEISENYCVQVKREIEMLYKEGNIDLLPIGQATSTNTPKPGLLAKAKALLDFEINEQLKSRGIDPSLQTPDEQEKAKKEAAEASREIVSQRSFQDMINAQSKNEVAGLQAFRTFEHMDQKGEGMIAVVGIHSPKSEQLQRALLGQGETPKGMPSESVTKWASEEGPEVLLYTHGVQVRTDEQGEVVLVSFGQATPVTRSSSTRVAASSKAKLQAEGEIRSFLGEMIYTNGLLKTATNLKEYSDIDAKFDSSQGFEERVKAEADTLKIPGIDVAFEWELQHPQADRETVGVVLVLSVSRAIAANELRERMAAVGGSKGGAGISRVLPTPPSAPATPKAQPTKGKSSSGAGAEGEDP